MGEKADRSPIGEAEQRAARRARWRWRAAGGRAPAHGGATTAGVCGQRLRERGELAPSVLNGYHSTRGRCCVRPSSAFVEPVMMQTLSERRWWAHAITAPDWRCRRSRMCSRASGGESVSCVFGSSQENKPTPLRNDFVQFVHRTLPDAPTHCADSRVEYTSAKFR